MAVTKVAPEVPDKIDNRYKVRVYNPRGGYYKKIIKGKRAAEQHEAEIRARFGRGKVAGSSRRQVLIKDYLEEILESKALLTGSSLRSYRGLLDNHVIPAIGEKKVTWLEQAYNPLMGFFSTVELRTGRTTRFQCEWLVRQMITIAIREDIIDRNPLDGVKYPKRIKKFGGTVAHELSDLLQVRDAWATSKSGNRGSQVMAVAVLDVLLGTGVRVGELLGISEDDVDYDAMTVTIRRQVTKDFDGSPIYAPPKTDDSGPRTIPVPQFVLAAFAATKLRNGTCAVAMPYKRAAQDVPVMQAHKLFFYSLRYPGKVYGAASITVRLRTAGRRLGLTGRLHAHSLRHRYTTTLADAGVPQRVIDYVTGHIPAGSVSFNVYSHVTQQGLIKAREATDAAWQQALAAHKSTELAQEA